MKVLTFFSFILFIAPLCAQLHDNTWVIGYPGFNSLFGHSILSFTEGSLNIDSNSIMHDIDFPENNACFSNKEGAFMALFNGIDIRNRNFVDLEGGGDLDDEVDYWTGYYRSFVFSTHGSVFLPFPNSIDSIFLLYESHAYLINSQTGGVMAIVAYDISAVLIDMALENGMGKVLDRAIPIVGGDTLMEDVLKAVKHANGRDWWLLKPLWNSKRYHRILVDTSGAHDYGIATVDSIIHNGAGAGCFSPDGSKYILYNTINSTVGSYLDIFDFDRCTGLLSNQIQIRGKRGFGGVAVSPNSRYLYLNKSDSAFQYDLWATDITASRTVVAIYDGFTDLNPANFYMLAPAPDGRIYGSATSLNRYLHIIHRPDEAGTACGYQQHGIQLYKYNDSALPNFPNYRLGPLDGSPCDTLGLDNLPKAWFRYEQDTLDALSVAFRDLSYYEPGTWAWDFGDGSPGSSEQHPQHLYDSAGVYQVCLRVTNPHGTDTHCKTLYLGVSATENPVLQSQIRLAPNPFDDVLLVALSTHLNRPVLSLTDVHGRTLHTTRLVFGMNEIEMGALPTGVYFYRLVSDGKLLRGGKLVKI